MATQFENGLTLNQLAERNAELVEALEKAQRTINEMDDRIRKQNRHVCELFDDGKALRERIAELESRTVKMPSDNAAESESPENDASAWFDEGWNASGKADKEALTAAGIKWEAE